MFKELKLFISIDCSKLELFISIDCLKLELKLFISIDCLKLELKWFISLPPDVEARTVSIGAALPPSDLPQGKERPLP